MVAYKRLSHKILIVYLHILNNIKKWKLLWLKNSTLAYTLVSRGSRLNSPLAS